jgi:glycerophosphoryl diester phosphodiesterase
MAVITFAHRGARLEKPENTIPAFRRALELGASGLETDVWLSADGEVVCVHDPVVGRGRRRRRVAASTAAELEEAGIPRLDVVYRELGSDFELSVDLKAPDAGAGLLAVARRYAALERLWVCSPELDHLRALRDENPAGRVEGPAGRVEGPAGRVEGPAGRVEGPAGRVEGPAGRVEGPAGRVEGNVKLVHSTRRRSITAQLERHAFDLAQAGIDAMNMHHTEWSAGLVSLFHRFGVLAFAWDAQEARQLRAVLRMDIDAVYCDRPDRMVATVGEWILEQPG